MKNLLKITILSILTLLSSFCYAKSNKIDVPDDIRVGLFYGSNAILNGASYSMLSNAKSSFTLSSSGGIEIGTMSDGEFEYEDETLPNEKITVTRSSKSGAIHIDGYGDIGDSNNYPYFRTIKKNGDAIIEIDGKKYRGNVEVRRFSESDMTVINHVSMQEYLYGVVPREIGGNSPIEAVKAQAIVARTYAAKNYNKRIKLGFNLAPNSEDQAYGGYEWEVSNSNKAVDETDGIVVTYDGELISGLYFSTSGGYTEDSENVWGGSYDYLKAVPDTYEPEIEGNTTWEVTMSAAEVKNTLSKNGINVGDIKNLIPTKLTDAGRVVELKVIGTNGEATITKSNSRTYLGLKSQWYTINDDEPVVGSTINDDEDAQEVDDIDNNEDAAKDEEDDGWYLKYDVPEVITKDPNYDVDEKHFIVSLDDGSGDSGDEPEELIELDEEELSGEHIVINLFNICVAVDFDSLDTSIKQFAKQLGIGQETKDDSSSTKKTTTSKKVESKQIDETKVVDSFTFRGRGWGHAVGMSQNGAKGMAKEGFTAEEIIKWYYSGVTLEG